MFDTSSEQPPAEGIHDLPVLIMTVKCLLKEGNKCDRNEWSLSGKGSLTRVEGVS